MDKMKKIVFATTGIVIAAVIFALLMNMTLNDLKTQKDTQSSRESSESSSSKQVKEKSSVNDLTPDDTDKTFIFLELYEMTYLDYELSAILVDDLGYRYSIDLTDQKSGLSVDEYYKIAAQRVNENYIVPVDFINDRDLTSIIGLVEKTNPDTTLIKAEDNDQSDVEKHEGITSFYSITHTEKKPQLVKIGSTGDVNEYSNYSTARTLFDFISTEEYRFRNTY